ncbi:MAG: Hint domain-containing protein [Maritimibacter sp.]
MTHTSVGTTKARAIRVSLPLCRSGLGLGTGVQTSEGELPVEFLAPGDKIVTFDAGLVTLSRVDVRTVPMRELVRIRPSVLSEHGQGRDVVLSARQKLLIRDWRAPVMFGKSAALVEARKLVDGAYMTQLTGTAPMRMFQLMFDTEQHVIQLTQGLQATSAKLPRRVASPA